MNTKKQELIEVIQNNPWMMERLNAIEQLKLIDRWICAEFIRNKV